MSQEQKYIMVTSCSGFEEHGGESWIDECKLNLIKAQAAEGKVSGSCSNCSLTIKDAEGNVIFIKEGC